MKFSQLAAALCILITSAGARAQSLGPPILLPGDDTTEVAAGLQQRPMWAAGADQFLVVWEDCRGMLGGFQERPPTTSSLSLFKSDLLAARFDTAGNRLDDAPIVVSGQPWIQRFAQVAWNGENYLVVWQSEISSALTYSNAIYAARVSPQGVLLDDPPILIEDSIDADEMEPAVASNGDEWVVTWHDFDPSTGLLSAEAAIVSAAGFITQKTVLRASDSGFYAPRNARISWAQDRYLVVWDYFGMTSGTHRNLYGRFFDAALAPLGAEFEIGGGPGNQVDAAVTTNGSQFFVAWGGSAGATPVLLDGTVVVPGGLQFTAGTPAYGWTPSVAWDGNAYLVSWEGATMQGYSIHAARIDTNGALLPGYPATIDSGLDYAMQSVTAGANGLGIVSWIDTRLGDLTDVWSVTLDAAGAVGPLTPVSVGAPTQTHADLDGNAKDGHLVSFVRRVSGSEAIQVQRVGADGTPIDPAPITLATEVPNRFTHTAVAHSPDGWLVVWENIGLQRTQGMRVGLDGTPLDPAPIDIVAGNTPDVAFLGGQFLVVTSYSPVNDVRVSRIRRVRSSDGALLGPEDSIGSNYAVEQTVEALEDRWMIAYERHATHDSPYSSISGIFVLADGTVLPAMTVASGSLATLRGPGIGAAGDVALVLWSDGSDLRGRRVGVDGTLFDTSGGFLVGSAPNEQLQPAAVWDGTGWVVAYTDYRIHQTFDPGVGDAYMTLVDADGNSADLTGTPLSNEPRRAEGGPAAASANGRALMSYVAFQDVTPYGTLRVELRSTLPRVGTAYCFGDGSGTPCPCGNNAAPGAGCRGSTGVGAALATSGSSSVTADDMLLVTSGQTPGTSALLYAGSTQNSVPFGDGLRCAGGAVQRLVTQPASAFGDNVFGPGLIGLGGWMPGTTRYFQVWFRDPVGGPCGSGFNLSNGMGVTFQP